LNFKIRGLEIMDVPEEKRKLSFTTNQINAVAANVKNLDRVSPNSNTSEVSRF